MPKQIKVRGLPDDALGLRYDLRTMRTPFARCVVCAAVLVGTLSECPHHPAPQSSLLAVDRASSARLHQEHGEDAVEGEARLREPVMPYVTGAPEYETRRLNTIRRSTFDGKNWTDKWFFGPPA